MYNLIITGSIKSSENILEIRKDRFLEYSEENLTDVLTSLSTDAIESIISWPCLLCTEGRSSEEVNLVKLKSIEIHDSVLRVCFDILQKSKEMINRNLWEERSRLNIEEFEFNRNHWSIKSIDLISFIQEKDYVEASLMSQFDLKKTPIVQRQELLKARDIIKEWSHTEIDDLLLEAGVEDLHAERRIGSRHDRANRIFEFVLDRPWTITEGNRLFSCYLLDKALINRDNNHQIEVVSVPILQTEKLEHRETTTKSNRVFVVHGRNDEVRNQITDFLSEIDLDPIVLHEQPNMGRHLLTKFIDEADLVSFAVVIMTDDDIGSLKDIEEKNPRARQNVVFELGYFMAHLGPDKVCALKTPGLETPSDFDGIIYIPFDSDDEWKTILYRELNAAELPVKQLHEE